MTWPMAYSTASQNIEFGPFVSTSDGITIVTSAIAANDIKLFKEGATGVVSKNSGAATYIANGYYYATFDAVDTNTAGRLKVTVNMTSSAALPVWFDAVVMTTNAYNAFYGTTSNLKVDVVSIGGSVSAAGSMSSAALSTLGGSATSTGTLNVSTMTVVLEVACPVDGQLQNRQVIFDRFTTTLGLREEQAQISTWTAATSTMTLTPSLNTAMVHGDSFRIF